MTLCKSLVYNGTINSCILNGSQPSLIIYNNLANLSIVYNLDTFLNAGQACLFNFTCDGYCLNGVCKCIRNLTGYNYGLIHEWTLNNTLLDSIQCNDLTIYANASFVQESDLPLTYSGFVPSSGYFSAPPDVYFSGDFTVTALVYVLSIEYWSRLIDFGNGAISDNVVIALSEYVTGQPNFLFFNNADYENLKIDSPTALSTYQWIHIAAVLRGYNATIYLNCSLTDSQTVPFSVRNVVRSNNYIGKSNWATDSLANAKFRNVRIYNRALNSNELFADFYNSF